MTHYDAILSTAEKLSASAFHSSPESAIRGLGACSGDDLLLSLLSPVNFLDSPTLDTNLTDLSREIAVEQQCRTLPSYGHADDLMWDGSSNNNYPHHIETALKTFIASSINLQSLDTLTNEIDNFPALCVSNQARRRIGPECFRFPPTISGLVTDPPVSGQKCISDGRDDTSLRFPPNNDLCTLSFSTTSSHDRSLSSNIDSLSSECPSISFIHISWENNCAPSNVFLQLSNNGNDWITSDFMNLDSTSISDLYDSKSKISFKDDINAPFEKGTLLHANKLVRHSNSSSGCIWKEQPTCFNATHARLIFHKFHKSNERNVIAIKNIQIMKQKGGQSFNYPIHSESAILRFCYTVFVNMSNPSPPSVLTTDCDFTESSIQFPSSLSHSLYITIDRLFAHCIMIFSEHGSSSSDYIVLAAIVRLLSSICLVSGSASALMTVVSIVVQVTKFSSQNTVDNEIVNQITLFTSKLASAIAHCHSVRRRRVAVRELLENIPTCTEISFDPVNKSSNMIISNAGKTISSLRTQRQAYASANVGFPLIGRHSWTFRVDQDIENDETTCVGFCIRPVRDEHYEKSLDMWLVRCYSGETCNGRPGFEKKRIPHGPIHPHSIITFNLLHTIVSMEVDGVSQGVVFEIPSDIVKLLSQNSADARVVYPCVQMYAGDRSCTILNCTSENAAPIDLHSEKGVPLSTSLLLSRPKSTNEAALKTQLSSSTQLPVGSLGVNASPGPLMDAGSDSTSPSIKNLLPTNSISLLPDIRVISALCQSTLLNTFKLKKDSSSRSAVVALAQFKIGSAFTSFSFSLRIQEETMLPGINIKSMFQREHLSVRVYGDVEDRAIDYRRLLFSTESQREGLFFGHSNKTIYADHHQSDNAHICLDVTDIAILTVVVIATVQSDLSDFMDETAINLGDLDSLPTFVGESMSAAGLPVIVLDDAFLGPSLSASNQKIAELLSVDALKTDLLEAASQLSSTVMIPYQGTKSGNNNEIDSMKLIRFYAEELVPYPQLIEISSQIVHLPLHSPRYLPQTPRVAQPTQAPQRRAGGHFSPPRPPSQSVIDSSSSPLLDPGLLAFANAVSRARSLQGITVDAAVSEISTESERSGQTSVFAPIAGSTMEGQIRGWSEDDLQAAIAASLVESSSVAETSLPHPSTSAPFSMPSIETIISLTGYDGNIDDIDEELAQALLMSLPPEALLPLSGPAKGTEIIAECIISHTETSKDITVTLSPQADLIRIKMILFGATFGAFLPKIHEHESEDLSTCTQHVVPPQHVSPKFVEWNNVHFPIMPNVVLANSIFDGTLSYEVSAQGLSSTAAVLGSIHFLTNGLNIPSHALRIFNTAIIVLGLQLHHLHSKRMAPLIVFPSSFFKSLLFYSKINKYLAQCLHQWLSSSSSDLFFASTMKKILTVIELIKSETEPSTITLSLWTSVVNDVRRGRFCFISSSASRNAKTWPIVKLLISAILDSLNVSDVFIRILEQLNTFILSRASAALGTGSPCRNFQSWELSGHFSHESLNTKISSGSVVSTLSSIEFEFAEHFSEYIELLANFVSKTQKREVIRLMDLCLSVCSRVAGNLSAAALMSPSLLRVVKLFHSSLPKVIKSPSFSLSPIINALSYPRRADRDNYSGQIGVRLRVTDKCSPDGLILYALGRAVCSQNGSRLQRDHILSLWNEDDQRLIATVLVSDESVRDNDGFAIAELEKPVRIFPGTQLRLTSTEYSGCGDGWYEGKAESFSSTQNRNIEDNEDTFIELIGDCYKNALSWIDHSKSNGLSQQANGCSDTGSGVNNRGSYFIFGESLSFPDQETSKSRGPGMATLFYRPPEESQSSDIKSQLDRIHTHAFDAASRSVASLIAAQPESEEEESTRVWLSLPALKLPQTTGISDRLLMKVFNKPVGGDRPLMYSGCHSQMLVPTETLIDSNSHILWRLLKIPESGKELENIYELQGQKVIDSDDRNSSSDLVKGLVIALSEGFDEVDTPPSRFPDETLELLKETSPGILSAVEMWRKLTVPGHFFPSRGRSIRSESAPQVSTIVGASAVIEEWLQWHSPEDRRKLYRPSVDSAGVAVRETVGITKLDYTRPKPRFSRVCGPFLAAILRHTDLAVEVVSALQTISSLSLENKSGETCALPSISSSLNRAWLKVKHLRNWIRDEIEAFKTEEKESVLQVQSQASDENLLNSSKSFPPVQLSLRDISNTNAAATSVLFEEEEEVRSNDEDDNFNSNEEGEEIGDDDEDVSYNNDEDADDGDEDGENGVEEEDGEDVEDGIFTLTRRLMAGLGDLIDTGENFSADGLEHLVSLAARQLVPVISQQPSEAQPQSQIRSALRDSKKESLTLYTSASQIALAISRRKRLLRANRIKVARPRTPVSFLDSVRRRCLYLLTTEVESTSATLSINSKAHLRGFITPLVNECSPLQSGGDCDQQDPLDRNEALMHVILTYTKQGTSASPDLLLSSVLRQLVRARQREIGLSLQCRLFRLANEGGNIINMAKSIQFFRESLSGRSKIRVEKACAFSIALRDSMKNVAVLDASSKYDDFEVITGGMSSQLETLLMTPTSPLSSNVQSVGSKLWMIAANEGELMNCISSPGCEFSIALSCDQKMLKQFSGRQSRDEVGGFDLRSYSAGCLATGPSIIDKLRDLFLLIVNDVMSTFQSIIEKSLHPQTDEKTRNCAVSVLAMCMSLISTDLPPNDIASVFSPSMIESISYLHSECEPKSIALRIESITPSLEDVRELFWEYSPLTASRDLLEGCISKEEMVALLRTVCKSLAVDQLRNDAKSENEPSTLEKLLSEEGLSKDKSYLHSASSLGRVYNRLFRSTCRVTSYNSRNSTSYDKQYLIGLIRTAQDVRATIRTAYQFAMLNCHILGCFRRVRSAFSSISDADGSRFANTNEDDDITDENITSSANSRSAVEALERNRDSIRRAHESLRRGVAIAESHCLLSSVSDDAFCSRISILLIDEFIEDCSVVNSSTERVYVERKIYSFLVWLTRVAAAPASINSSGPLALLFTSANLWTSLLLTCVCRVSPRVSQQTLRILSLSLPRMNPNDPVLLSAMLKIREDSCIQQINASISFMHYFLLILSNWMNPKADDDIVKRADSDGNIQWPFISLDPGCYESYLACSAELISTLRCLTISPSSTQECWHNALAYLIPKYISTAALSATEKNDDTQRAQIQDMKMGLACLAILGSSSGCESLRVGGRVLVRSSPLMSCDQDGIAYAPVGAGDAHVLGMATIVNYEIGSNSANVIFEGPSGPPLSAIVSSFQASTRSTIDRSVSDVILSSFDEAAYIILISSVLEGNTNLRTPETSISAKGSLFQQTTPTGCSMLTLYSGLSDSEGFDLSLLAPIDTFPPPTELILLTDSTNHLSFLSSLQLLLSLNADMSIGLSALVPDADEIIRLRAALRTSSLSAFDSLIANPVACSEIASTPGLLKRVMDIALVPSSFPTFVCLARSRQREIALKSLLNESLFGFKLESQTSIDGSSMLHFSIPGLADFNTPIVVSATGANVTTVRVKKGLSGKNAQEMTEEILFESQAQVLVQMGLGFNLDACKYALSNRGGNLDSAANWLMSAEGSARVRSETERQRVADISLAASREPSTGPGAGGIGTQSLLHTLPASGQQITKTAARWREAAELASILGYSFSEHLCFQALLLRGENKDSAMEWLLDSGSEYFSQSVESPLQEVESGDVLPNFGKLSHEAALDDICDITSLLPTDFSIPLRAPTTGSAPPVSTTAASVVPAVAAALMPPSLRNNDYVESEFRSETESSSQFIPLQNDLSGESCFSKADIAQHKSAIGASELTLASIDNFQVLTEMTDKSDEALRIVYNTTHTGDVIRSRSTPLALYLRGRCGVLLPAGIAPTLTSRRLMKVCNPETGTSTIVSVDPLSLRGINRIFGRCVSRPGQFRSLLVENSIALGALISRRIAAAIVHMWPSPQPLLGIGASPLTLDTFGGGSRFVTLVKLIAAASQAFSSSFRAVENGEKRSGQNSENLFSAFTDEESFPIVSLLQLHPERVTAYNKSAYDQKKIIDSETAEVSILSGSSEQFQSRTGPLPLSLVDAARSGLTRLLVQEVQSKQVLGFSNSESSRGYAVNKHAFSNPEASPLLRPMNTPMIRSISYELNPLDDLDLGAPHFLPELSKPHALTLDTSDISLSLPTSAFHENDSTESKGKDSDVSGNETKLARILVEQCVRNFIVSTSADDNDSLKAKDNVEACAESLHPIVPICEYAGELSCAGALAIRVSFDFRCELDPLQASLVFFSDRTLSQRLATYPLSTQGSPGRQKTGPAAFPPLLVHSDKVFFLFKSTKSTLDLVRSWGYRLIATPMRGLQWLNDIQVVANPSLEWACWLLEFFLHDAGRLSRELFIAVHHKSIFDALVRYLQSPGAPFKSRVIVLLTQLLAHPDAFPDSYTPDLKRDLLPISNLFLERAHSLLSANSGSFIFLPPAFLRRVELASATLIATRFFESRICSHDNLGYYPTPNVDVSLQTFGEGKDKNNRSKRDSDFNITDNVAPTSGVAGFAPVALKTSIRITKTDSNEIVADRVVVPVISRAHFQYLPKSETQGVLGLKNSFLDLADLASSLNSTPFAPSSACASGGAASASVNVMPDPNDVLKINDSERASAILSLTNSLDFVTENDLLSSAETVPGNNSIRFKDSQLLKAWDDSCGSIAVVETMHPYHAGESFTGEVTFPGAKSLRISLDRRTTLALGCSLRFWVSNKPNDFSEKPIEYCGAIHMKSKDVSVPIGDEIDGGRNSEVHLGSGATIADTSLSIDSGLQQQADEKVANYEFEFAKACSTSAKLRIQGDMKAWTSEGKDVIVVYGGNLRFAFVAPNEEFNAMEIHDFNFRNLTHTFNGPVNDLGLWGAAFTVSAIMYDSDETKAMNRDSTFSSSTWIPKLSLDAAAVAMAQWPRELDELIVSWINTHSIKGGDDDLSTGLGLKGSRRIVRSGLDMCPDQFRLSRKEAKFGYEPLSRASISILHCRFSLLRLFNCNLLKVLELVDATSASGNPHRNRETNRTGNISIRRLAGGLSINEVIKFNPESLSAGGSMLSQQLRSVSHLVFSELKNKLLDTAVMMTTVTRRLSHQSLVEIHLDNMRALLSSEAGQTDLISGQCIFLQAFRQLSRLSPTSRANLFRSQLDERGCLFRVRYVNEQGIDYGGVFRDACTKMTEDIFSDRLDLFLPTANAALAAQGRQVDEDALGAAGGDSFYLPNPKYCSLPPVASGSSKENGSSSASSRLAPQLYEFVGQLMAMSLRTKLALPFEFPSIMWKLLVGQSLTLNDLQSIDAAATSSILSVAFWSFGEGDLYSRTPLTIPSLSSSAPSALLGLLMGNSSDAIKSPNMSPTSGNRVKSQFHEIEYSPIASAAFARAFPGLRFSTKSLDGRLIDLVVRGGNNVRVTLSTRWQYVQAALEYHLTAYDSAVKHIQSGLYSLVPARALRFLSWHELAFSVAGRPDIDINQLRKHTIYEGYRANDSTITMFWRVFDSISNAERSLFIRFAWGRSRLPVKWGSTRFKLAKRPAGDEQLPVAHTCFFSVELPPYSNESRMRTAILAAIYFSGGILSA